MSTLPAPVRCTGVSISNTAYRNQLQRTFHYATHMYQCRTTLLNILSSLKSADQLGHTLTNLLATPVLRHASHEWQHVVLSHVAPATTPCSPGYHSSVSQYDSVASPCMTRRSRIHCHVLLSSLAVRPPVPTGHSDQDGVQTAQSKTELAIRQPLSGHAGKPHNGTQYTVATTGAVPVLLHVRQFLVEFPTVGTQAVLHLNQSIPFNDNKRL